MEKKNQIRQFILSLSISPSLSLWISKDNTHVTLKSMSLIQQHSYKF